MSYTKREWATGNVVGAVDLNRMEQGIEDAGSGQILVVNSIYDSENDSYTLDKTWQEIYDAYPLTVEYFNNNGFTGKGFFNSVGNDNNTYAVLGHETYITSSSTGYPTTSTNSGGGGIK